MEARLHECAHQTSRSSLLTTLLSEPAFQLGPRALKPPQRMKCRNRHTADNASIKKYLPRSEEVELLKQVDDLTSLLRWMTVDDGVFLRCTVGLRGKNNTLHDKNKRQIFVERR